MYTRFDPNRPFHFIPISLLSELDERGWPRGSYTHLFPANQTPTAADTSFSTENRLWELKTLLSRIKKNIKWENTFNGCFPYCYGQIPGKEEITELRLFERHEGEI